MAARAVSPWLIVGGATATGTAGDTTLAASFADANVLYYRLADDEPDPPESDVSFDTRRQQPVDALRSSSDDPQLFDQTLQHLTENRLLTLSGEEHSAERWVDLAHEALIGGWPTLQSWLAQHREAELMRRRLEEKVSEWVRLERNKGGLLDEIALAEAESWLAGPNAAEVGYDALLLDLIQASREVIVQQARLKRRSTLISTVLVIASTSAVIVANIYSTNETWRNVSFALIVLRARKRITSPY